MSSPSIPGDLKNKLEDILGKPISCDDPDEWAYETDNGTLRVQFSVSINENMDKFYVEIFNYTENIPIKDFEADNPKSVLQAAREFKSKYINRT